MIRLFRLLDFKGLLLASIWVLSGCAVHTPVVTSMPMPVEPVTPSGAIYQSTTAMALFEDLTARRVGDVLTVLLSEDTQASKSASTSSSKTQSMEAGEPSILGRGVTRNGIPLLGLSGSSGNNFSGEGSSKQSNSLEGSITVVVTERLSNGLLRISGEKWLALNQGREFIQLTGLIRSNDINPDNTILSTKLADARITYSGTGSLAQANRMGWVSRVINSGIWPF